MGSAAGRRERSRSGTGIDRPPLLVASKGLPDRCDRDSSARTVRTWRTQSEPSCQGRLKIDPLFCCFRRVATLTERSGVARRRAQRSKAWNQRRDIRHAFANPVRVFELDDGFVMLIGATLPRFCSRSEWSRPLRFWSSYMPCVPARSS